MEESIYNLLPKEKTPPKKKTIKLYKSSIPGTLAPTGSTFGSQSRVISVSNLSGSYIIDNNRYRSESGILGKSKHSITFKLKVKLEPIKLMGKNDLSLWAERGERHRSMDSIHDHTHEKPEIPKLSDKPVMSLKQSRNFIATNAIEVILANAKRKQSEPDWTKKSSFGKIPLYLSQIKDTLKEQYQIEQMRKQVEKEQEESKMYKYFNLRQQLKEEELDELRAGLKKKYDELNLAYQQQTHCRVFGTIGVKRRKENFEKQLSQLEQDMEKLNKKYVFIQH